MSDHLLVTLHDVPAGELRRDGGSLSFTYFDAYVADAGPPISQSLPVTREVYGNRLCMAVFGGVLPEQDVRRAVASVLGVSASNDYQLLEELGGDCAGALEFLVDGVTPDQCSLSRELDHEELDHILRQLPQRPLPQLPGGDEHIRMSLAGAQSKLPVIQTLTSLALPGSHGQPSTHIIKPEPAHFPSLVANEAYCMTLARALELDVARVAPAQTLGGLAYLYVERYDRDLLHVPVQRLHQEDMCQALGRLPDQKYQQEGGPSVPEMVALLRAVSGAPTHDLRKLWDALAFNVLIGNCDAHGKNYSLLYDGRRPMLAPLYDLVATAVYPNVSQTLAMRIGGTRRLDDVTLDSWRECAEDCELAVGQAVQRVQALTRRTLAVARAIGEPIASLDDDAAGIVDAIYAGMQSRARRWGVS